MIVSFDDRYHQRRRRQLADLPSFPGVLHDQGWFLQNPGFILDRGHLNEQNDSDSDMGLYCSSS